jgi:hypothetical protein
MLLLLSGARVSSSFDVDLFEIILIYKYFSFSFLNNKYLQNILLKDKFYFYEKIKTPFLGQFI